MRNIGSLNTKYKLQRNISDKRQNETKLNLMSHFNDTNFCRNKVERYDSLYILYNPSERKSVSLSYYDRRLTIGSKM